jgi:hypothetical protein
MVLCLVLATLFGCEGVTIQSTPAESKTKPDAGRVPELNRPQPVRPGCDDPFRCPTRQHDRRESLTRWAVPYCDLPESYRIRNYAGGSCVHASLETVLHWQGQHELAQWWRANYAGGEYTERLHSRLEAAGVRFAFTTSRHADGWEFLRKCCALRLACAVNLPAGHMQTLVGMDERAMYVIDNNGRGQIDVWPRQRFAQAWTGWAVTVVGQAPPPEPFL